MRFTDRGVKALKPRDTRYEVFEDGRKGLGLRISPRGGKSWVFVYRRNGKLSRITVGAYPDTSVADAHAHLASLRATLRRGADPAQAARTMRQDEIDAPTVTQLAHLYIERYAKMCKRSWHEDERILEKDAIPRWGHFKAKDIKRRDVVALLDDIVNRGSPIAANRTLACVRKMFNYGVERSILEASPCVAVKAPSKETRRDRVLTDGEICAFWEGLERTTIGMPIRYALKLQLVTAQRKGEIVAAEWPEFDLNAGWWTIPADRSKNHLAHRVPISLLARELLHDMPRLDDRFLCPSPTGNKPVGDTSVDHAVRRNLDAFGVGRFTPHDLRRTAASHMTSIGIPRLVVSKILNHAETGVTAVYDRHSYDAEKREALDTWGRKLEVIVGGVGRN